MSDSESSQRTIDEIRKHLATFSALDADIWRELRRMPSLMTLAKISRDALTKPATAYEIYSSDEMSRVMIECQQLGMVIDQLGYSPESGNEMLLNPGERQRVQQIASNLISYLLKLNDAPKAASSSRRDDQDKMLRKLERDASETRGRLEEQVAAMQNELRAKHEELTAALMRVEQARKSAELASGDIMNKAAEKGAQAHGAHFRASANSYNWILAFWLFGAGLMVYLIFQYVNNHLMPENSAAHPVPIVAEQQGQYMQGYTVSILQKVLPRLLIIGMYFTCLVFCLRNFVVSRHNQILNRHRALSMDTFLDFVRGTGSEEARSSMVQFVANCVFTPQPTGYVKTDGDMPQLKQLADFAQQIRGKESKE